MGRDQESSSQRTSAPTVDPHRRTGMVRLFAWVLIVLGMLSVVVGLVTFLNGRRPAGTLVTAGRAVDAEVVGTDTVFGDSFRYVVAYEVDGVTYRLASRVGDDPDEVFEVAYDPNQPSDGRIVEAAEGIAGLLTGLALCGVGLLLVPINQDS